MSLSTVTFSMPTLLSKLYCSLSKVSFLSLNMRLIHSPLYHEYFFRSLHSSCVTFLYLKIFFSGFLTIFNVEEFALDGPESLGPPGLIFLSFYSQVAEDNFHVRLRAYL